MVDHVSLTTGDSATGSAIRGPAGTSVDVAGANPANGTAVRLRDCDGSAAQRWTVGADGTIIARGTYLDVTGGGTADGTAVQLYDCEGTGAPRWTVTGARDIVDPQANTCLDMSGGDPADGTRLQIWTCTGGADHKWTVG